MSFPGKMYFSMLLCFLIGANIYAIMCEESEAIAAFSDRRPPMTLIIDPGHGGADGGAVSLKGTKESEINLSIALHLRELCCFFGRPCLLTREREELDYPPGADSIAKKKQWDTRSRVELINVVENGFLLSIHQNCYPSPEPQGPQVFYNSVSPAPRAAETWQETLAGILCPGSRRVAAPVDDGVYIMAHAECPAVLAECGFLSNPQEAEALDTETYRTKIAASLMAAYLRFLEETYEK